MIARLAKGFIGLCFIALWTTAGYCKEAPKPQVLDFELDVIEGESMRPDLFLQISAPDLNLDAIAYMRKDFNDFHRLEKNRRPKFVPEKK